ncbi:MAG: SusC/RagA family TonB-linked outer membrane protein, partial [Bacteroidetes bacterium]|nr:SusC/RagA family TonB-linked outer membrane protein [Bacteroidota bacterium]
AAVTAVHKSAGRSSEDTNIEKQKLISVLKELNRTKGIYFLFSEQSLGARMVNVVADTTATTEKLLEAILKDTGLKYKKVNDKTFVILQEKDRAGLDYSNHIDFTAAETTKSGKPETPAADPVTGKVTTPDGTPLANVSVTVKGTSRGTSTNNAGVFTLQAAKGEVLIFSFVGYAVQEIKLGEGAEVNVSLQPANTQLNEVVVTALGIQRRNKDLTYATQRLNNSDLTTVKDANFVNSLTGKVAGVTITRSASGLGGSARVVLRGNKSTRENQPLYVIDGVPMANFSPAQPNDVWGQAIASASGAQPSGAAGRDGGDGISNLNPDDIESVTILKGASGAALYGSQAANGAIVITTKSGKAGKTRINFSSDITAESPLYYPDMQFRYGQGGNGNSPANTTVEDSWGPVVNAPDHVKSFFRTGVTTTNSIALTGGTDKAQTYFSYANTSSKGILPSSSFMKHNLNFRETAKFFHDRLTVDANTLFLSQTADNRPVSGLYANPLTGLYLFPRGLDFNKYKNYQYFSQTRNMMLQNWFDLYYDNVVAGVLTPLIGQDHEQNPYWLLYNGPRSDKRDRAFTNLSLKYKLNDWLSIQVRGNFDKSIDTYDARMNAGTQAVQAAPNGRYTYDRAINTQMYGDVILTANKSLTSDLDLQATLGSSITDAVTEEQSFDTDPTAPSGLYYANKFGVNYIMADALVSSQARNHRQQQAIFANAQLGYKGFLFLDLTGRNDWSSTFAFTPTAKKGYFYYSTGLNLVLSEALHFDDPISFAKFRVSYAKVGNDVPVYITNPSPYKQDNRFGAQVNTKAPVPGHYLLPEDNRSFEVGTEWRFLKDRIGVDLTYYINNNYRQYTEVAAPLGSGYSKYYVNLGNIQNKGIEATIFAVPVATAHLKWTTTFNLASNKNRILQLSDPSIPGATPDNKFFLTDSKGINMYYSIIQEGGAWGDIWGSTFQRAANGSILVDSTGSPLKDNTPAKLGNPNPTFTLGWNNTFDIGRFNVSFLVDGRFGGKVMSVTQAVLDVYGDSKASAAARDNGGVAISAVIKGGTKDGKPFSGPLPAQLFYKAVGGRNGTAEYYMYDATAIRMRELAVGYKIPVNVKGITDLKFSLIARNLFFFSKKAPFDPEVSMATNNGLQGIEAFGIPSTRSIG